MLVGRMRVSTFETRRSTDLHRSAFLRAKVEARSFHSDTASGSEVERRGRRTAPAPSPPATCSRRGGWTASAARCRISRRCSRICGAGACCFVP